MELAVWLIVIGIVAGAASLLAGKRGVIAVVVIGIVVAIFAGAQSSNMAMFLAYMLAFGAPVIVVTVLVAAWTGNQARQGKWGLALIPVAIVCFLFWKNYRDGQRLSEEKHLVHDFIDHNEQLRKMAGGDVKIFLGTPSTHSDAPDYVRYDNWLDAREPLHVIVDVYRDTHPPTIRLACVTARSMGSQRTSDHCSGGIVPMGDTRFARTPAPGSAPAAAAEPIPELPAIPKDASVHLVGTHEARNHPLGPDHAHEPGDVTVFVAASTQPLLLVLTSYEPVRWNIQNLGRPISAVLTSGHYPSTVTGTDAKVVNIGKDYLRDDRTASLEPFRTRMRMYSQGPFTAQYQNNAVSVTVQPD